MKKIYKDDPIFASSKLVLSLYDDCVHESFSPDFAQKVCSPSISLEDIPFLKDASGIELAKTAIRYSDGVIFGAEGIDPSLKEFCASQGVKTLPYNAKALSDGSYIGEYNAFYEKLHDEA